MDKEVREISRFFVAPRRVFEPLLRDVCHRITEIEGDLLLFYISSH